MSKQIGDFKFKEEYLSFYWIDTITGYELYKSGRELRVFRGFDSFSMACNEELVTYRVHMNFKRDSITNPNLREGIMIDNTSMRTLPSGSIGNRFLEQVPPYYKEHPDMVDYDSCNKTP